MQPVTALHFYQLFLVEQIIADILESWKYFLLKQEIVDSLIGH